MSALNSFEFNLIYPSQFLEDNNDTELEVPRPSEIPGTNTNNETIDGGYIFDRLDVQVIFITLYSIVFLLCFVGNLIVLIVVSLHWRMRRTTKLCLANLAFADFCVGIFCVYQNLSTFLISSWVLGEFFCKMYQFVNALSQTASIITLVVVCGERYLAIVHPFTSRRILTKGRLSLTIGAIWLASSIYCCPRLIYMTTLKVPSNVPGMKLEIICTARRTLYDSRTFDMINIFLLFLVPLALMSVLYFRVGLVLWRSPDNSLIFKWSHHEINNVTDERIPPQAPPDVSGSSGRKGSESFVTTISGAENNQSNNCNNFVSTDNTTNCSTVDPHRKISSAAAGNLLESPERRSLVFKMEQSKNAVIGNYYHWAGRVKWKMRRSVVKMLMVIVTAFALCHLPFHLRKFAVYWKKDFDLGSNSNTLFLALSHLCVYVNCAINPIIYGFMSSSFRSCLKDVVRCKWSRRSLQSSRRLGPSNVPIAPQLSPDCRNSPREVISED